MTYSNKFVMCVLIDGVPQKELENGAVHIPFNSEYALRFRNKNSRRAVVKIYIDGENVSGGGYVVPANDFIDIKRHSDKDVSFKFVSLDSAEAVEHGKNGPNPNKVKGTIEARFYLEKERKFVYTPPTEVHHHHHYPKPQPWRPHWTGLNPDWSVTLSTSDGSNPNSYNMLAGSSKSTMRSSVSGSSIHSCGATISNSAAQDSNYSCDSISPVKDGCTVEGSHTGQYFSSTYVDMEETYTSLKLFLQGTEEVKTEKPVKVRKTNKDMRLDDLEAENEELRKQLAELENEQLKSKLSAAKKKTKAKSKPKPANKKKTK